MPELASTDADCVQREFGKKLGEVQIELAKNPGVFAMVRNEFGTRIGEVQTKLSENFADMRIDVARLEGTIAGAGFGNANAENPGTNI